MPFQHETNVPDFIECKPDILKLTALKPLHVNVTDNLVFMDRMLPPSDLSFIESESFSSEYFVNLHNEVKKFGVHNYRGTRLPLKHNNINVDNFRTLLCRYNYPDIHILQFVEFGFPLGLWSNAFLEPCSSNHSSAYSYYSYVDKFVDTELNKFGIAGPFEKSPWEEIMLSPLMTSHKKPNSRRAVFDASFGFF